MQAPPGVGYRFTPDFSGNYCLLSVERNRLNHRPDLRTLRLGSVM